MDDDLVLVHMSGATQSKESWLQDIADETMRYYKIDVTKFDGSVDGDRAVVKATNVIEIAKDRDGGNQDIFIPLWYEPETKRLKNDRAENKIYGWDKSSNDFTSIPVDEEVVFD